MQVLKDTHCPPHCKETAHPQKDARRAGLAFAIARGMFGHRQLSSVPQFPAFTISAAGQEVWEGDIIELNQLLLLDTLRELKAIAPFFLLCKSLQNKPGYGCPICLQGHNSKNDCCV